MSSARDDDGWAQVDRWAGEFGREYTDRNVQEASARAPAFRTMLNGLPIRSVLEVGCNRGHNLVTLAALLGEGPEFAGIEPNGYAREIAQQANPQAQILDGNVYELPFADESFDLVFTSGVLIHVPLSRLDRGLSEIHRISRRYVLAIEYFGEEETPIRYRDHDDLLWKRDFLGHYLRLFPELRLVGSGFWTMEQGFDRSHWWMLEKPGPRT